MTDRPMIFSAPMVRALLAGRKTQTRLVLNASLQIAFDQAEAVVRRYPRQAGTPLREGDRLWVRENHRFVSWDEDGDFRAHYAADEAESKWLTLYDADAGMTLMEKLCEEYEAKRKVVSAMRTRPSIHMPRWASRLTLEVTDVRVERLQDIDEGDAISEGALVERGPTHGPAGERGRQPLGPSPRQRFEELWRSLHGADAWSANPWVAALTFSVTRANIDVPASLKEQAA